MLLDGEYAHVPCVVFLIQAVAQWSAANGGERPTAYRQKKEVKSIVESFRRLGLANDVNIEEALAAVNTALNLPQVLFAGMFYFRTCSFSDRFYLQSECCSSVVRTT